MSGLFRWLVGISALSQLLGAALIIWGLKVVPVSNPFTPFARDLRPEGLDKRPGLAKREHPRAVASGAVLFLVGLAVAVVAGVARPQ
jgi:hypothetical protein